MARGQHWWEGGGGSSEVVHSGEHRFVPSRGHCSNVAAWEYLTSTVLTVVENGLADVLSFGLRGKAGPAGDPSRGLRVTI